MLDRLAELVVRIDDFNDLEVSLAVQMGNVCAVTEEVVQKATRLLLQDSDACGGVVGRAGLVGQLSFLGLHLDKSLAFLVVCFAQFDQTVDTDGDDSQHDEA